MISFTWKYSIFQVIQIFIIICYFLQFLFCIGFGYNDVTINILLYELLLIFLWSLFSAIHESGTFNLYVLFLYMLCVFIYSRIFLDIYGLFNWTWADRFHFPYKRTVSNINIVNIFIAIYASWMLDG